MAFRSLLALTWWSVLSVVWCDPQAALTSVGAAPITAAPGGQVLATAAPALDQSQSAGGPDCGGCYLVLDVAAVVWYKEVFAYNAATAQVSVGMSNGSRTTSTSFVTNRAPVTLNFGSQGSNDVALNAVRYGLAATINGATLNSPTAYNVLTAYAVTSAYPSAGICMTVSGTTSVLPSAYSEPLSQASGFVTLNQNDELSLVSLLGFSTCSVGAAKYSPTVLAPVTPVTPAFTTTYSSGTPMAAMTGTSIPSLAFPSANAPTIVIGNSTFPVPTNPLGLPTINANGTTVTFASTGLSPIQPTRGNNASTSMPVPFISRAPSSQRADGLFFMSAWILGLVGFGFGVYRF